MKSISTGGIAPDVRTEASDSAVVREAHQRVNSSTRGIIPHHVTATGLSHERSRCKSVDFPHSALNSGTCGEAQYEIVEVDCTFRRSGHPAPRLGS